MTGDDPLIQLKAMLLRARRQPMNFAVGLGKQVQDHQLGLHPTRAGRALAKEIKDTTALKQLTWGTTELDASRPDTLVLVIEDKPLGGLQKKLQGWLKLQGLPVRKVAVKVDGRELAEDGAGDADGAGGNGEDEEGAGKAGRAGPAPAPFAIGASPRPAPPQLTTLEAAFKQLLSKVKTVVAQDRTLDALLLPAVKACQLALQQGDATVATAALKKLAQQLQEAQTRLDRARAEFETAVSPLDTALAGSLDKVRRLQTDPRIVKDRQQLARTSATLATALRQARQAARSGNAAEVKALKALIAKERAAARKVLAPYWPGGTQNPEGDWALIVARLDLSSAKDGAVFWSGDKDNAIDLAMEQGGTSLESTGGGAMIDDWNDTDLPWNGDDGGPPPYMMALWQLASAEYALQAKGRITVIQTPEKQLTDGGEMWRRVERKILLKKELQGHVTLTEPVIRRASPGDTP